MKFAHKFSKNAVVLMALGLPLTSTNFPAEAKLVDRIDFETGDFSQIKTFSRKGKGIEGKIVTAPSRQGKYAAQFGFEAGSANSKKYNRSELAADFRATPGQEYWYGWSLYIPEDFEGSRVKGQGISVSQLHGYNPDHIRKGRFFQLQIKDGQWHLWLEHQKDPNLKITRPETKPYRNDLRKDLGRVEKGKWVDFVVNVKWTHKNDGFLKMWIDGEQVLNHQGSTYFNIPNGPMFKAGPYTRKDHGWSFLYIDEVRVGDHNSSYAEVSPGGSSSKSSSSKESFSSSPGSR